ncbi:hypothetical protein MRS44_012413 [Fusarium solani]|uniref:uncharacterized protein n=1 Tax=Fusarium solani TaxID=169388 RepID=UPI0032C499C0|nr:hypothetical protein MRS44_012413 [Fusarium solani]
MSSPVDSGCSPDYPHEDPVGQWTQSGLLAQGADPFGFMNQEGFREMSSGSMPQIAMDDPILGDEPLPPATGMDSHLDSIDPALLVLPATTDSGFDPSLATSNESGNPVPVPSDDVDSLTYSGEVLINDQAQAHSLTSDDDSSSADTSSGSISGTENGYGLRYREDAIIRMRKDECVEDGIFFCNRENCTKRYRSNSRRTWARLPPAYIHVHANENPESTFGLIISPFTVCTLDADTGVLRGRKCSSISSLVILWKSHTYPCPVCREGFTRQDNQRRHLDEIHGGKRRTRSLELQ